jgi:predicted permease
VLVVGEVGVAVLLLIGAGILVNTLQRMHRTDLGFNPSGVLTAEIGARSERYRDPVKRTLLIDEVLDRIRAIPGVKSAAVVNWLPMTNNTSRAYAVEGQPRNGNERPPVAGYRVASPEYQETMGIRLKQGRFINAGDTGSSEPVAVVNERFAAAHWPGESAVGKRVALYVSPELTGEWRTVVGVIGDIRHSGPAVEPRPEIFLPFAQQVQDSLSLAIRTQGDPAALARTVEQTVLSVDSQILLSLIRPMERVIADAMASTQIIAAMLTGFSLLGLGLASIGLYGVISYLVSRRTHEFGVRLALGATRGGLVRLVLRRALWLTGSGTAFGLLGGLGVGRILRATLYDGIPVAPKVFIATAMLLGAVALAASWMPVRRALALDPLRALHSE